MQNRPFIFGIITFLVLAALVGYLAFQRYLIHREIVRQDTYDVLVATRERINAALAQGMAATKTMALFVRQDGSVGDFDSVAAQILALNPLVDVIQMVPGGVIRQVYPLKGNESVLGYNILKDPLTSIETKKAISNRYITYAGPLELKQGGIGVVGRLPIYRNDLFWGFSAVVIRLPNLLPEADTSRDKKRYYFQLSKIDPLSNKEVLFFTIPGRYSSKPTATIDMPEQGWKLGVVSANAAPGFANVMWLMSVGLLLSTLGGIFVYTVTKKPEVLDELVKQRTAALQKSEQNYRSLIEHASEGIVITDLNGIIKEVNNSVCKMGNYLPEDLIGYPLSQFLSSEDLKEMPLRFDELREGKILSYERNLLKKDGSVLTAEINSSMATSDSFIGFIRDVTGRRNASNALRLSNERFELIAKATNDAIWDYNFETHTTIGNQNLYDLFSEQGDPGALNLEAFWARIHPDDAERISEIMQTAIREQASIVSAEFRFRLPSGLYRHIYDRAFINFNESGQPVRILGVMQDITERMEDKQQLLKEKQLSDSIINSLPAVFYLYNEAGVFQRWNNNFETITGYTPLEIATLHPLDLFDEEEKRLLGVKIRNVFVHGKDSVEANFLLKDGRKIPYYFTGMRIEYEGQPCLMGFGLDFSDKTRATRLLKESEEKFRGLVEQASDGIAILSETGAAIYVSPAVERILGYTEQESLGLNLFDITHPDDKPNVEVVYEKVMGLPGVPMRGTLSRTLHKDGTWRWLEDTITNMLHVPAVHGIVENFRDVTEQIIIEQKIRNEKELSDSIINNLPGIFYLYDSQGHFIRWNAALETVTGYSGEEIKKMHPVDFYEPADREIVKMRMKENFIARLAAVELNLLTKDGSAIPYIMNSVATEYEGLPCVMGMGFDVSDRKKIEQELVITNHQLELKAAELITSYTELERFTYIVSHDLQEPLRMVSSFLKLLNLKYNKQLDETAEKYINFAVDGAERMKRLIMDLLEYSRTGTNKEQAADTNMNEVMQDVRLVMETAITEKKAVLEISELPVLPNSSKLQMFQLMQNLLSNALKYAGEESPVIQVAAVKIADHWQFSVTDNGIGIDPKFSEKIFVIFQRLHNRDEFSGTGIGLSICKKIVERHGGKIWVESSPGKGSTFYFTIKRLQSQVL